MPDRRPHVVAHVATALDGATTGFDVDAARFYELAATWREDVTLTGADTILAQSAALAGARGPGPRPDGPLLAVVDGRRRVPEWMWPALRDAGHWRDAVAVRASPGAPRVDLAAALAGMDADVVRVDSGGGLLGALLVVGLVDEVSLLVHPALAAGPGPRWWGDGVPGDARFELVACEGLGGGLAWLRYRVA